MEELDVFIKAGMEDWKVKTTPSALTIVFFNVYYNAVQQLQLMKSIRKKGRVWPEYNFFSDDKGDKWGIVLIHDTGPGIHKEDWEDIFKPGFTTKKDGTGLGLYLCRSFLDKIRAKKNRIASIDVSRSVLFGGTTFIIKLPLI